jgi:hypothetical protein
MFKPTTIKLIMEKLMIIKLIMAKTIVIIFVSLQFACHFFLGKEMTYNKRFSWWPLECTYMDMFQDVFALPSICALNFWCIGLVLLDNLC